MHNFGLFQFKMKIVQGFASALIFILICEASGRHSKSSKKYRSKSYGDLDVKGALEFMREAEKLPPPYKIPIRTIDVVIDPTPRPSIFLPERNDMVLEPKRENKDYIMFGVFDKLPRRYHILAPLEDHGEPVIADYSIFYPGSNTPIGLKDMKSRKTYSSSSSSSSGDSSSESSGAAMARRRGRRAVSLGSDPKESKKDARARDARRELMMVRERNALRQQEMERKELEKKKGKSKKISSEKEREREPPIELNRPCPADSIHKKKKDKKEKKERNSK